MFTKSLLPALGLSLALGACDSDILTVNRDFDGATINVELPATTEVGTQTFVEAGIMTELRERLEEFDIEESQLRRVEVESVTLTIKDPSGEFTFDDVTAASISLTNSGLGTTLIATLPDGATGTESTLTVADVEVQDYLLSDTFDATLEATTTEAIGEGVSVDIAPSYSITAGLPE